MGQFTSIRNSAIKLVKKFGRQVECTLVRSIDGEAPDATKPWNVGSPTVRTFKFIGVVVSAALPGPSEPQVDADSKTIIVPGDIAATASEEDAALLCGDVLKTDRVTTDSITYGIEALQNIKPDDLTIIWKLRCSAWPSRMP